MTTEKITQQSTHNPAPAAPFSSVEAAAADRARRDPLHIEFDLSAKAGVLAQLTNTAASVENGSDDWQRLANAMNTMSKLIREERDYMIKEGLGTPDISAEEAISELEAAFANPQRHEIDPDRLAALLGVKLAPLEARTNGETSEDAR